MEISGLNAFHPFSFPRPDKDDSGSTPAPAQDVVRLSSPALLADHEVGGVLHDTLDMIAGDGMAALSAHSGLSRSRVFALLGM